ncbi:MAG: hypothetical protein ACYCOU_01470 [Sulfobacillus sp.]
MPGVPGAEDSWKGFPGEQFSPGDVPHVDHLAVVGKEAGAVVVEDRFLVPARETSLAGDRQVSQARSGKSGAPEARAILGGGRQQLSIPRELAVGRGKGVRD